MSSRNKGVYSSSNTGVAGVGWSKCAQKWRARIQHNNKSVYLGLFENFDDAVRARKTAERLYF